MPDGRVKILDFGLAKLTKASEASETSSSLPNSGLISTSIAEPIPAGARALICGA